MTAMNNRFLRYMLISVFFLPVGYLVYAAADRSLSRADLRNATAYHLYGLRSDSSGLLQKIKKGGSAPGYYLYGRLSASQKKYRRAFRWLTTAVTGRYRHHCNSADNALSCLKKFKARTSVAPFAVFETAELALKTGRPATALKILEQITYADSPRFQRKIRAIRASAYRYIDSERSLKLYLKLAAEHNDPFYLLRAARQYHKQNRKTRALQTFFRVLEHPRTDWTYIAATKEIDDLTDDSDLNDTRAVRFAEGLRIIDKPLRALKLFNRIDPGRLSSEMRFFYAQNFARLLIDFRRYDRAVDVVKTHADLLSSEREKELLGDIADRLNKADRYRHVTALVPDRFSGKQALFEKVQALYKTGEKARRPDAEKYIREFDKNSFLAQKTYFADCLDLIMQAESGSSRAMKDAVTCLEDLRKITENTKIGGASRYHLALLYEKQGEKEKAVELFREVYLNSPSDFYVGMAFEKGRGNSPEKLPTGADLSEIRRWIAANAGFDKSVNEFFRYKKKNPGFAVDPYWHDWQKKLDSIEDGLNGDEAAGFLHLALGLVSEASYYLRDTEKAKKYLLFQKAAQMGGNRHYAYYYLKRYIIETGHNPDIFLMSENALRYYYPAPYRKTVQKAAGEFSVEEAKIYALMKQESAFNPYAKSWVGARGLMQVMPNTAKWINRSLRIRNLNLYRPSHSIRMGTKFYSDMIESYSADVYEAAVAYNAGPGRLREWRRILSDRKEFFIEQIPFRETHHYVKITGADYDRYRWLLNGFYAD